MITLVLPEKCTCRPPVTTEEAVKGILDFLSDRAPLGFSGMVDNRVKDEDFVCCPKHANPASCPASGCEHCFHISITGTPIGAMVDTADTADA